MAGADLDIEEVKEAVAPLQLKAYDEPIVTNEPAGSLRPCDLPLVDINEGLQTIKHVVDLIQVHEGVFDRDALKPIMQQRRWDDLPHPLRPKTSFPEKVCMQICIVPLPAEANKVCILKHLAFPNKVKPAYVQRFTQGTPMKIQWSHPKTGMKMWQWMFEKLGHFQCREWALVPYGAKKKNESVMSTLEATEIDQGFDHIGDHAPRHNRGNAQMRWVTKETNSKDSPIHQWPVVLVEKAIRNLSADGVLALPISDWPLTLKHINTDVLYDVLLPVIPLLTTHGLLLLGEPGGGKTPMGRTIAMAIARHQMETCSLPGNPSFRSASEMDFFRGEEGAVVCPDIFDDGDCNTQSMRKVKAFMDVGETEAMSKERWGAAKWVKGQLRIMIDNAYFPGAEPHHDRDSVEHADFYNMIVHAFLPGQQRQHYMAIFKRAAIVLNTKEWVYVRLPGEREVPVRRKRVDCVDYLNSDAKPIYAAYKNGDRETPTGHADAVGWERKWMHHAFAKHAKKPSALVPLPPPTFAGPVLFESAAPKPEDHFEVPVCPPGTPRPEDHFEVPVCPPGRMPSFQLDRSNGASSSSHGASREASSSSGGAREGVAKSGPKAFEKLTRKISAVCIDLESGSSQGSPPPKKVALPGDVDCGEVKLEPIETADEDPFDLLKMGLSDGA